MNPGPRVLLAHRYYWPDTAPYGRLLKPLATGLAAAGMDVTIFSTQPFYGAAGRQTRLPIRSREDGVRVIRSRWIGSRGQRQLVRLSADLAFVVALAWHLMIRKRYDLVTVSTSPPVAAALAVRLVSRIRGSTMIYHCQDLHPEAAIAGGVLKRNRLAKLLQCLDSWTCARAERVVVLSADMRDGLAQRGLGTGKVTVLQNFIVPAPPNTDVIEIGWKKAPGSFLVLFAGNLGRYQGLESIMAAAELLQDRRQIHFVFVGEGVLLPELLARAGKMRRCNVSLLGFQPQPILDQLLAQADAALVTLKPGMHRYCYPSKTQTYLAAGCRLLAAVDEPSELATMIRARQLGEVCPPDRPDLLAQAILGLSGGPIMGPDDCLRARRAALEFSEQVIVARWLGLIRAVLGAA